MAKNTSREFATMDDDGRRRFAREHADERVDLEDRLPVEFPPHDLRRQPRSAQRPGGDIQ
jgi:hypothetical protein